MAEKPNVPHNQTILISNPDKDSNFFEYCKKLADDRSKYNPAFNKAGERIEWK